MIPLAENRFVVVEQDRIFRERRQRLTMTGRLDEIAYFFRVEIVVAVKVVVFVRRILC